MKKLLGLAVCLALVGTARGADASLLAARAAYEAAVTASQTSRVAVTEGIVSQYTNALVALKWKAQGEGDLDKVREVLAEMKRFAVEPEAPSKPPQWAELRKFTDWLGRAARQAEEREAAEVVAAAVRYEQALNALQVALTREGRIDEAIAVRDVRKTLAASATYKQAAATLEEKRPAAPSRLKMGTVRHGPEVLTAADWQWDKPLNLGAPVNSTQQEMCVTMTDDRLDLVVAVSSGPRAHLVEFQRDVETDVFRPGVPLAALNLSPIVTSPSLSADGLRIYFCMDGGPGQQGVRDMYCSQRAARTAPWSAPLNLGAPVNSPGMEWDACPSRDGLGLLLTAIRPGAKGLGDIYRFTRASLTAPWAPSAPLSPALNTAVWESMPCRTTDPRAFLFVRTAPLGKVFLAAPDGRGELAVQPLDLPVTGHAQSPWLAPDGVTLYFSAMGPGSLGGRDIWRIRRIPRPQK